MRNRTDINTSEETAGGRGTASPPSQDARHTSLLTVLWRRQLTVGLTIVLAMGIALAYIAIATPIYTGISSLYVEQNGPRVLAADSQGLVTQSDSYLYTQCELLKSGPILTAAVEKSDAAHMRMMGNVENIIVYLKRNLDVTVGKKDEIISIALDSPYPDEAANLVNSIVDSYVAFQAKQKRSTAGEVLKILQREKEKQDNLLDAQMQAVVSFKQANGEMFFNTEKGMNILTQGLANISDQLIRSRLLTRTYHALDIQSNNKVQSGQNYLNALEQEKQYEDLFEQEKEKALQVNSKQAEFQKLQATADRTTKLCDMLDARIKELNVTEDTGAMNISVLEVAKVEDKPTHPRSALTMAVALLIGVLGGCGLALAHDFVDQRILSVEEVTDMLGLPVAGIIPTIIDTEGERADVGRKIHLDPSSDIAEAYRTLRTGIYFGTPDQSARTILLTSPSPGDGKSTSASNLAIAMAQSGQRTLLIDADLRKPVQHKVFAASNDVGLSNVVARGFPAEKAIQRTEIEGLDLLPCGELPPNPAEILNSQSFADLIDTLSKRYDQILIDSPPVLPVTDARILAARADLTILVLRMEKSTRKGTAHATDCLLNVGARLFGAIVNDVPRRRRGYGYYYTGYDTYESHTYGGPPDPSTVPEPMAGNVTNGKVIANGHEEPLKLKRAIAFQRDEH